MEVIDFKPVHGLALLEHFAQQVPEYIARNLGTERFQEIASASHGHCHSGMDDGHIFVCAGLLPVWPGCWRIWAMISRNTTTPQMLSLHRAGFAWLDQLQESWEFRRIETTARADHTPARRWLEMLGFECEGHLRRYDADGNDHKMYARVACHSTQPRSPK